MALKKYRRQVIRVRDANDELPEVILSTGDEAGRIIQLVITGGENYGTHCRFWLQKEEGLNVYQDMEQVTASYPTWEAAINTGGLEPGVYPCMFRIGDNDGSVTETFKTTARVLQGMLIDAEESEEMQSQLSEFEQRTEDAIAANETATAAANDAAEAATAATNAIEHALDEVDVRVLTTGVLSVTNVDGVPTSYDVKQQVSDAINPKIEDADAATQAANDAASAANSAALSATDAATAATSATSAATQATTAANSAASSANSAASDASAATTSANNAAAAATSAASSATSAAAAANEVANNIDIIIDATNNGLSFIDGSFSYGIFENNYPVSDPRKFNAVMMQAESYDRDITVRAKEGYNFLAYFYNSTDEYISKSTNWENLRIIPANTYFRLWVRPNPLDTSVVLDLEVVKHNIVFQSFVGAKIDENSKSVIDNKFSIELSNEGYQTIDSIFAWGTMSTSTGTPSVDNAYKYQVITPDLIKYDEDITIVCNSGYEFQAYWYDSQGAYISRMGSFGNHYEMSKDKYFRLFVRLSPSDTSAVVQPETFKNNIYIKTIINKRIENLEINPLSTMPTYILNNLAQKNIGALSKGYILLSCDDGTSGLATYTIPMLIDKGVPATFGLLSTSEVITNQSYLSLVIDAINNHGCCVAQHGSVQWPTYSEDELVKYFDNEEAAFLAAGINKIYGAICPGGSGADTNTLVQAIAGGRFGSVFSGGMQGEIKYGNYSAVGARTNLYAMARYSAIGFTSQTYKTAIDNALENHYILCPFWHDYTVVDNAEYKAIIEGLIDYAKSVGIEFITTRELLALK